MGGATGFLKPELVVVGAGPAGVSAALWARSQGLSFAILEGAPMSGGQLHHIHFRPREVPGIADRDGPGIAAAFEEQLGGLAIAVRYHTAAVALEPAARDGAMPCVITSSGERFEAGAVLIATGVRRRHLDVPGEREFEGRGVSYSATRDRAELAGRETIVVGGGDAAFENALLLAEVGCRVTIVVRGVPRAREEFRERVAEERRIRVADGTRVTRIAGDSWMRAAHLEGPGGAFEIPAEGVVIKVGAIPNTEWCRAALDHDAEGYVEVDAQMRTSTPRVWAAGDVVRPAVFAITVAEGAGALAVADIRATLRGA